MQPHLRVKEWNMRFTQTRVVYCSFSLHCYPISIHYDEVP